MELSYKSEQFSKISIDSKWKALEYYQRMLLRSKIRKHIAKIILYGSLAKGIAKENSDIDILIIALDEISEIKKLCLDISFETALKFGESIEPLIYCIDETRFIESYFLYQILNNGKEIYLMDKEEIKEKEWKNYLRLAIEYQDIALCSFKEELYRGVVDAAYNSAELCAKGCLLTILDEIPSTHGGVVQKFGEIFVLSGKIEKSIGRELNSVLYSRNKARYDYHVKITKEDAEEALKLTSKMIDFLRKEER
ncbi:MAG: HEPN domain-containing protein [bacterium]|nr:HEPN domain-containing protein [bacterium]